MAHARGLLLALSALEALLSSGCGGQCLVDTDCPSYAACIAGECARMDARVSEAGDATGTDGDSGDAETSPDDADQRSRNHGSSAQKPGAFGRNRLLGKGPSGPEGAHH